MAKRFFLTMAIALFAGSAIWLIVSPMGLNSSERMANPNSGNKMAAPAEVERENMDVPDWATEAPENMAPPNSVSSAGDAAPRIKHMGARISDPEKDQLVEEIKDLRQQISMLGSASPQPKQFGYDRAIATAGVIFGAFSTVLALRADRRDKPVK